MSAEAYDCLTAPVSRRWRIQQKPARPSGFDWLVDITGLLWLRNQSGYLRSPEVIKLRINGVRGDGSQTKQVFSASQRPHLMASSGCSSKGANHVPYITFVAKSPVRNDPTRGGN